MNSQRFPLTSRQANCGFLFATFKGESSPLNKQVGFGLSKDGRGWQAVISSKPVLVLQTSSHSSHSSQ